MKKYLLTALLTLLPISAFAQVVVVDPNTIEFTSPDHVTQIDGQPVIVTYVFEVWSPGTDTTGGSPVLSSPTPIPKATATVVAGTTPIRYRLKITDIGFIVTPGPEWVATIKSIGPTGLTSRSPVSNSFKFPLAMRAPLPTGAPVMIH